MSRVPFEACIDCQEAITNPVCPNCLAEQMKVFVGETNDGLASYIYGANIEGSTQCISCQQGMGLCAHCFSRDIYCFILENDMLLAKEFKARFDFDLRRKLADFN